MAYVISTLLNSIQLISVIWFFDAYLLRKHQRLQFWIIALSWNIMECILLNVEASILSPVKVVIVPFTILILSALLYFGGIVYKIFLSVSVYSLFNLLSYALQFMVMLIYGIQQEELVNDRFLYSVTGCANTLCMLVFSQIIKHFHSPAQYSESNSIWIIITTVFPASSIFVLLLLYIALSPHNTNNQITNQLALICLCVFVVANVVVLVLIDILKHHTQEHEKLVVISQREKAQNESITALSAAYDGQRRLTHDFQKHMSVLADLLQRKRFDEATHYIELIQVPQTERILLVNTHHAAIDAILNQKGYEAQKYNIDIRFEVNDLSGININASECTIVLGNLLDNAIESCKKFTEEKTWIQTSVLHRAGNATDPGDIFISVLNPSLPVKIENNNIKTTKTNPSFHGFGLQNVKYILDKYHAEYYMTYENGQFVFSLEWPNVG